MHLNSLTIARSLKYPFLIFTKYYLAHFPILFFFRKLESTQPWSGEAETRKPQRGGRLRAAVGGFERSARGPIASDVGGDRRAIHEPHSAALQMILPRLLPIRYPIRHPKRHKVAQSQCGSHFCGIDNLSIYQEITRSSQDSCPATGSFDAQCFVVQEIANVRTSGPV